MDTTSRFNLLSVEHFYIPQGNTYAPIHCVYKTKERRLETFKEWQRNDISAKDLAEAGFYFKGDQDITLCFHCGLHVYEWLPDDIPFVVHAKFSPHCKFVYIKCGKSFVHSCRTEQPLPVPMTRLTSKDINRYTCKICFEKEINCALAPCEHSVSCSDCTATLTRCPMCRSHFSKVFRLKYVD